jgi:hypothetical protein
MLCSTIAKSVTMAAVFGLLGFFLLSLMGAIRCIGDISPYVLASRALEITLGNYHEWLYYNVILALAAIAALLIASIQILKKKEL